ncbi:hypothetical protein J6590_085884 [Homalodisca vitripennis]|nr:hypothetical protein J6590_085884 [Homalodisca vitripennis]
MSDIHIIVGVRQEKENKDKLIIYLFESVNAGLLSLLVLVINREKLILYLSVSVSAGLLSLLVLVISRLLWQRRRRHVAANTTLPNYADDLSEVDTDIDLTAPATITILSSPLPPGEVVRFGSDCSAPRSLSRSGNNQYYYG